MTPPTLFDIIFIPAILIFIGLLVYVPSIVKAPVTGKLSRVRFIGIGLLVLAFFSSLQPLLSLMNPDTGFIYRTVVNSRKVLFSHYAMPTLSLAILAAIPFVEKQTRRALWEEFGR